ncbi:hypothetical protein KIW84_063908 [Lathyrus oleraceus]|uniref:Retrotransposon gag domain-containing protein n=1 Tax=Pisum sativum TaxID=3888 RepID=A0A9D5A5F7_PEA|nr:hypothetical protein KIW84_063908 [Pisum sativum]
MDNKEKIDFLTRALAELAKGDPRYKQWKSENSLIIVWLVSSMETGIGKPYMFLPSAKDVWEAVKETYSDIQNSFQIFGLKSKLWHAKQGDRSVTAYYNELLTLWQELDLCYDDNWRCTEDNVLFLKRQENDRVFMFFAGLNKDLDEVRGRVLGKVPLPTLREIFAKIRREEARQGIMMGKTQRNSESEGSTLAIRNLDEGRRSDKVPWVITASANGIHVKLVGSSKANLLTGRRKVVVHFILDLNSRKMIGSAKESGGLYYLEIGSASQLPSKTISSCFESFSVLNNKDDNIMASSSEVLLRGLVGDDGLYKFPNPATQVSKSTPSLNTCLAQSSSMNNCSCTSLAHSDDTSSYMFTCIPSCNSALLNNNTMSNFPNASQINVVTHNTDLSSQHVDNSSSIANNKYVLWHYQIRAPTSPCSY